MSKIKNRITRIEDFFNSMELVGILIVLSMAVGVQFILHEDPCPLCMLQRGGFLMVALGLVMNLRFGLHSNHYAMIILSAIFSSFVSLRQIALNLNSPNGGFGSPFLGLHLYTWVFIIAMIIAVVTTLIMSVERQYQALHYDKYKTKPLLKICLIFIFALICVNIYTAIKLPQLS